MISIEYSAISGDWPILRNIPKMLNKGRLQTTVVERGIIFANFQ